MTFTADMVCFILAAICLFIGWWKALALNPQGWPAKLDYLCGGLFFMVLSLIL